uniref:cation:proton antiporter regulatory subunit n=1 Tax=Parenemella sanctibonifatiensis TaxID=2016505 RepID=UPI0038992F19
MDYIADQAGFPDIDVRQRLAVSTGYGVAEIAVMSGSDMIGKTLDESGLREKDIQVLTLHRGTKVIPNPLPSKTLEDGDRLLCFGKHENMRALIPARSRRARRVRKLSAKAIQEASTHPAPEVVPDTEG